MPSWYKRARGARVAMVTALSVFMAVGSQLAVANRASAEQIVGVAAEPGSTGWWSVTSSGRVVASGSAGFYGQMAGHPMNKPIVGMAATPDGGGYWLVASDGGVFTFGDARFSGSTGGIHLNKPVVAMAPTPDGGGYWLVASDGGIFTFGDARFLGSTGAIRLNKPILAMAATPDGNGYWLVASDGGVFTFGDARFFGSAGSLHLGSSIVGAAATTDGDGYWLVTADGGVFPFGDAISAGSAPRATATFGIIATRGGGYTVLSGDGPHHFGPPVPSTAPTPLAHPAPADPTISAPSAGGSGSGGAAAPGNGTESGRRVTIGVPGEPQIVRSGSTLASIDPADPSRLLNPNWKFAGVDAYELNTLWGMNLGCGSMESQAQIDNFFGVVGPGAVVRVWFFQQFAIDRSSGQWNWTAIDRVVRSARTHGVHLVATLGNQDGTCDDGVWKDPSWYSSGWSQLDKHWGDNVVSFRQWVQTVVSRYASEPAILAWEPMNEPRPDTCTLHAGTPGWNCWNYRVCPSESAANSAVRGFFDQIGGEIRGIDPNHLISDGALAVPGCGFLSEAEFDATVSSAGIDLVSLHDYTGPEALNSQALSWYTDEIGSIGKPVWVGENGDSVTSGDVSSSAAVERRLSAYTAKVDGELGRSGLVGWMYWFWSPSSATNLVGAATSPSESLFPLVKQTNQMYGG